MEVLNRVPRDKLPQVLAHILDKRAAQADAPVDGDSGVFSTEEMQQLTAMLQLTEQDINHVVTAATLLFREIAAFGDSDLAAVLQAEGLESGVVAVVEKLWRKKGRALTEQFAVALPFDASTPSVQTLKHSDWQLQLELGSRFLSNQSDSKAVFQLELEGNAATKAEKLDIEMNHVELFAFFQQLNAIQRELDDGSNTVVAVP